VRTGDQVGFSFGLSSFIAFRDQAACERARRIRREDFTRHPNADFRISVVDEPAALYAAFADDLVDRIRAARAVGEPLVVILPAGPLRQYELAARTINRERLSLRHVHTFNMDEFANEDGVTAPTSWPGSFQRAMWKRFFSLIDAALRPPEEQIHFPTTEAIRDYSARIEALGGADVCYGGIGWSGHVAFWEPHLGAEFDGDLERYKAAGARLVELHPITVMQSALQSFGGDWSAVPPCANTIGPRDVLRAKHRSFWLAGGSGGDVSWQRFIARLVAHGPVSEYVPGSLLQTVRTDYTVVGSVAADVEYDPG
jgi:glucosamine-6-phosphate deaminase